MKKIAAAIASLVIVLSVPTFVHAQTLPSQMSSDQEVVIGGEQGPHFRAGNSTVISEDLTGDVYAAGNSVIVEGRIDGDLIVGGANVIINGEVTEDVRVGAGNVLINGRIGQDLTVGAGTVSFAPESQVGGSVLAAARTISFDGIVGGDVWMTAGNTRMSGDFGRDIHAQTTHISVQPTASISGSLMARYDDSAQVSPEASIAGEARVTKIEYPESQAAREAAPEALAGLMTVKFVFTILVGLVSGLIIMYLFPRLTSNLAGIIVDQPLTSFGWGLVELFLLPIIVVILAMLVLTLPLTGLLLLAYLAVFIPALWLTGRALGQKIGEHLDVSFLHNHYWQFVIGFVLLKIIGLIPVIGWMITFVAYCVGAGALFMWAKSRVRAA